MHLSLWLIYHRVSGLLGESKWKVSLQFPALHRESAPGSRAGLTTETVSNTPVPWHYSPRQNVIVWNVSPNPVIQSVFWRPPASLWQRLIKYSSSGSCPRPTDLLSLDVGSRAHRQLPRWFWCASKFENRCSLGFQCLPTLLCPRQLLSLIGTFSPQSLMFVEHPETHDTSTETLHSTNIH